ncbi:alpha/beta hydrolase family protein [Robertkochia aurantiaca]|uniref:alpha/beta hydrolase family protein n=1 Tax=Robertkochia aurantiaca TaxID=2873700 RepID=UPI001CCD5A36|nr:alpha/beta fold hydrolase [Robertkochia sp. 3YJGBD-33]
MKILPCFLLSILMTSSLVSQEIQGDWYGSLEVQGTDLPLVFHIEKTGDELISTMDSPKQGAFGIEVEETSYINSSLTLKLPQLGVTYTGTYEDDKKMISGTFEQNGMRFPLNLSREKIEKKVIRPQEPNQPYPYRSLDVTFKNQNDNILLAGTLTFPENSTDFPTVILISGSGAQNRDEEIAGHKPFLVLADHLTRSGIAVLRFDDRGTGASEGNYSEATTEDLSRDVIAAVEYLRSNQEIDADKIGLIGHSEGGIIAPLVASKNKNVDFMVLLAGPCLRGDEIMLAQKKLIELKSGFSQTVVAQSQEIFKKAYALIDSYDGDDKALSDTLTAYFSKSFNTNPEDPQITGIVQYVNSPWMRYYLSYDPRTALENTEIPTLALFGKKDLQVPAELNTVCLEEINNDHIRVIQLENLNHLFQNSQTGLPNEYDKIEQTFSPEALNIISEWINDQF